MIIWNGVEICLAEFPGDGYDKNENVIFEYDEPYHHSIRSEKKETIINKTVS